MCVFFPELKLIQRKLQQVTSVVTTCDKCCVVSSGRAMLSMSNSFSFTLAAMNGTQPVSAMYSKSMLPANLTEPEQDGKTRQHTPPLNLNGKGVVHPGFEEFYEGFMKVLRCFTAKGWFIGVSWLRLSMAGRVRGTWTFLRSSSISSWRTKRSPSVR